MKIQKFESWIDILYLNPLFRKYLSSPCGRSPLEDNDNYGPNSLWAMWVIWVCLVIIWELFLEKCEEHAFTCLDGGCVPNNTRCDGENNCKDGSDEYSCGKKTTSNGISGL